MGIMKVHERTFWDFEKACEFANQVGGRIEVKFWKCGQKDYVVRWCELNIEGEKE